MLLSRCRVGAVVQEQHKRARPPKPEPIPTATGSATPVLLSLKPRYAALIFAGVKSAEFRRRPLTHLKGRDVFVYVTSPVKELRGGFRVGEVWTGTPEEMWSAMSDFGGVDKREFDAYYAGRSIAYALEVAEPWRYAHALGLRILKERFPGFVAPQSWRYVKPQEHRSFQRMQRDTRGSDSAPGHDRTG